ncbi:MAG: hypothetical protein JXA41_01860 [Deltaproteobacteria bacterium]|nr:hypothetical protein [Deltaproteobacteria bacterium]
MNTFKIDRFTIFLSIILILISLWILNHPYKGLVHDARLYAVQALSHIEPSHFYNELFLSDGSQDNYTIFSDLYVHVINLTNFSNANMILLIIGHILWFFSAYLLAGLLNRGPLKFIAMALVVAMPSFYGAKFVFSYGEPFLTPRIYAESFVLFSIFFALKNRFALSAVSLLVSILMHPIMALTGITFFFFYFIIKQTTPVMISGGILAAAFILLAIFNVAPCDRIFKFMDYDWASIINLRVPLLFIMNWNLRDFLPTIASALVIMLYAATHQGKKQTIAVALFTATGISLPFSMFGGDIIDNVLVLQLQVWRITWLLLFFSYLFLPTLYIKIKKETDFHVSFLTVYGAAWLSPKYSAMSLAYVLLAILSFILIWGNLNENGQLGVKYGDILKNKIPRDFRKKINIVLVLLSVMLLSLDVASFYYIFNDLNDSTSLISLSPPLHSIYALLLLIVGALLLYFQLWKKDKRMIVLSMIFFLIAVNLWDRRLEFEKLLGGTLKSDQLHLLKDIPPESQILWLERPTLSWFALNRSNYVSKMQGAGVIFSQDTAALYNQRTKNLGVLGDLDDPLKFYREHQPAEIRTIYRDELKKCCQNAKDLEFIVASCHVPEYDPLKILSLKNIRVNYTHLINLMYKDFDWYLYRCQKIKTLY